MDWFRIRRKGGEDFSRPPNSTALLVWHKGKYVGGSKQRADAEERDKFDLVQRAHYDRGEKSH